MISSFTIESENMDGTLIPWLHITLTAQHLTPNDVIGVQYVSGHETAPYRVTAVS